MLRKKEKTEKSAHSSFTGAGALFAARLDEPLGFTDTVNRLEYTLYEALRANLPVLDACIIKTVRLTGGFKLLATDERWQEELEHFQKNVPVGVSGLSLNEFADIHLDSMLTYGKGIGEVVMDGGRVLGLLNGDPTCFRVGRGENPCDRRFFALQGSREVELPYPERVLYSALNPNPKNPFGVSVFRGIPALAGILLKIYRSIGQNFERVGNVRYAVTYKPQSEADAAFAKERAEQIAKQWSEGMTLTRSGDVKDFVAVGDVDIKVIGADNKIIDTEIPVRQILEQMISKLSIPPFLLGLNWSSTERMSTQQCDILTSELEYYRRLLTPVISQAANIYLASIGADCEAEVEWDNINLLDETELARARLYNAQARELELQNSKEEINGQL